MFYRDDLEVLTEVIKDKGLRGETVNIQSKPDGCHRNTSANHCSSSWSDSGRRHTESVADEEDEDDEDDDTGK